MANQELSPEESRRVETRLRDELRAARVDYVLANANFKAMLDMRKELGPDQPDGDFKLRDALHRQQRTLLRYSKAARAFANFIVHGNKPDPNL